MRARRALGLQGWLVAALLAVGLAASLAVLLVVLPTLESSVRTDRAKREAQELRVQLEQVGREGLPFGVTSEEARRVADEVGDATGADVRIDYAVPVDVFQSTRVRVSTPQRTGYLDRVGVPEEPTVLGDGEAVAASAPMRVGGADQPGWIVAVQPISGVAPELAIVRRRVIIAMIVVLGLAAIAGIALARVLGGRMRRLASTAATLAGGDLSARAPEVGVAPEEIQVLRRSINGMAERLESLVGAITSERDRDRALVGSLAEGVLAVGPDGTVTVANDAAGRYLGLPEDEGPIRLDALPPAIIDAVLAARAEDAPPAEARQVTLGDGVELELTAARLGEGPHAGTVITLRDVTAQRRLDRARRDLVANVSHELKTPIAALKGFLELLEGDGVSERHRREFLAAMSQEAARLERLVEEQLQLARLDAGALPLRRERIDLGELTGEVVAPRVALAARQGIALSARPHAGAPVEVDADPARIEQILLILLDNALRHTPAGGRVEVAVGREDGEATVTVRDTGEGIPAESQAFVFDRFYRGDASREGRSAGLGLAIARGLAAAHQGSIGLESAVGEGSAFTLRLPASPPGPPAAGPPAPGLSRAGPG
ncbi:MAG TPA: ATP-binding protein [Miltoncostaeaceae bacterium]|nr:ATP-binding protein [Miltoncostaeaceae bacterium]